MPFPLLGLFSALLAGGGPAAADALGLFPRSKGDLDLDAFKDAQAKEFAGDLYKVDPYLRPEVIKKRTEMYELGPRLAEGRGTISTGKRTIPVEVLGSDGEIENFREEFPIAAYRSPPQQVLAFRKYGIEPGKAIASIRKHFPDQAENIFNSIALGNRFDPVKYEMDIQTLKLNSQKLREEQEQKLDEVGRDLYNRVMLRGKEYTDHIGRTAKKGAGFDPATFDKRHRDPTVQQYMERYNAALDRLVEHYKEIKTRPPKGIYKYKTFEFVDANGESLGFKVLRQAIDESFSEADVYPLNNEKAYGDFEAAKTKILTAFQVIINKMIKMQGGQEELGDPQDGKRATLMAYIKHLESVEEKFIGARNFKEIVLLFDNLERIIGRFGEVTGMEDDRALAGIYRNITNMIKGSMGVRTIDSLVMSERTAVPPVYKERAKDLKKELEWRRKKLGGRRQEGKGWADLGLMREPGAGREISKGPPLGVGRAGIDWDEVEGESAASGQEAPQGPPQLARPTPRRGWDEVERERAWERREATKKTVEGVEKARLEKREKRLKEGRKREPSATPPKSISTPPAKEYVKYRQAPVPPPPLRKGAQRPSPPLIKTLKGKVPGDTGLAGPIAPFRQSKALLGGRPRLGARPRSSAPRGFSLKKATTPSREPGLKKKVFYPRREELPDLRLALGFKKGDRPGDIGLKGAVHEDKGFRKYIMQVENDRYAGYKDGKFYPYNDTEIGFGHQMTKREAKEFRTSGATPAKIMSLLHKDLQKAERRVKAHIARKFGPNVYNKLDRNRKQMLIDFAYNMGNLAFLPAIPGFPKFIKAVIDNDVKAMKAEYKRTTEGKPLTGRNRDFLRKFLSHLKEKKKRQGSISDSAPITR